MNERSTLGLQILQRSVGYAEKIQFDEPGSEYIINYATAHSNLSVYGDDIWDISAWSNNKERSIISFRFWKTGEFSSLRQNLIREAKYLIYTVIWMKGSHPVSNGTLLNYMATIRALVFFAESNGCNLRTLFTSEKFLLEFVQSKCTNSRRISFSSLLVHLEFLGEQRLGFQPPAQKFQSKIRLLARSNSPLGKQTPPIPTRVYSIILSFLIAELEEWRLHAKEALMLLDKCAGNLEFGRRDRSSRNRSNVRADSGERTSQWCDVASAKFRSYLKNHHKTDDILGLGGIISEVQLVSKLIVQAFSGMRDNEALTLRFDCLVVSVSAGISDFSIKGFTTKLSKSPQYTKWVTNREGYNALTTAKEIALRIYSICADEVLESSNLFSERPLFVSVSYVIGSRRREVPSDNHFFAASLGMSRFASLRDRMQPPLEEVDLLELEQIDEHRSWRSEPDFQVGHSWKLHSHQFRRSLALYAQRSGLVTLPSLKRQLQHITSEMTRYYSRGSQYAVDLFGMARSPDGHFCREWQQTRSESEGLSYLSHVLGAGRENIFGGHADFVKHRILGPSGVVTPAIRAETKRLFNQGLLSYKETILGGCTRLGECDRAAIDWIDTTCVTENCAQLVGNFRKLEVVIDEQKRFLESISKQSVMYRTEMKTLNNLEFARNKILETGEKITNER